MPSSDLDLSAVAERVMRENGFDPSLPADAARELEAVADDPPGADDARDLRSLKWSSIDNAVVSRLMWKSDNALPIAKLA